MGNCASKIGEELEEGEQVIRRFAVRLAPTLVGLLILVASVFGQSVASHPCRLRVTVVWTDQLNNVQQGLSGDELNWFKEKIEKKYPDVCYAAPDPSVPFVFVIMTSTATYHGTATETSTNDAPVTGTITDENGNTSTISGHETITRSSTVPRSFDYPLFTLSIETREAPGRFKVLHNFLRKGICPTLYGICMKNRHPNRGIIEDAVKWIHNGGLGDPLQSVLVPATQAEPRDPNCEVSKADAEVGFVPLSCKSGKTWVRTVPAPTTQNLAEPRDPNCEVSKADAEVGFVPANCKGGKTWVR